MSRRRAALAIGALVLVLAGAALRVHQVGRAALAQAEDAHARGDDRAAVMHAGDAARARVPFVGTHARALDLLSRIAHDAEGRGDAELAQAAALETLAAERATALPGAGPSAAEVQAQGTMERLARKQGTALPSPPEAPPRWPPLLGGAIVLAAALGLRRLATSGTRD